MNTILLCPAQQAGLDALKHSLATGNLVLFHAHCGRGRTTVLQRLLQETGGILIGSGEFLKESSVRHPLALEEALFHAVANAFEHHEFVYVDDIDLLHKATSVCHYHPRGSYIETAALELATLASSKGRKLVLSTDGAIANAYSARSFPASIPRYSVEDYAALLSIFTGPAAAAVDCHKIFRFAPKLTAHQLKAACSWLSAQGSLNTDTFIEYLRTQRLASNVDLGEVQNVNLADLQGVDDVIRSLDIHIVLPLENDALSSELGLRPKRGVLLYGPPGTGKTTIGRALAHRLKGKFFLIDGTFIAGTGQFYGRVHQVFEAAKENSPAVIFIDDADAIFEDGEERGLYRYLLTMLDGLESEGGSRVCVMMTAMNLAHLPPALIRSGRVELWLEMKLPDAAARARILDTQAAGLPADLAAFDRAAVIALTEGFTGADIKRLVSDAKGRYAFDRATESPILPAADYFASAAEGVRENKQRYQAAEEAAVANRKPAARLPGYFYPAPSFDED